MVGIKLENAVKWTSVIISGAGGALSGIASHKPIKPLATAGATASLVGSLLDDVPETWIKSRTPAKFNAYLRRQEPTLSQINAHAGVVLAMGNPQDPKDRSDLAILTRALNFFKWQVHTHDVCVTEHATSTLKAIFAGVGFGLSAKINAVMIGGFAGAVVGTGVSAMTCYLTGLYTRPVEIQNMPSSQTLALCGDLNANPRAVEPQYNARGDYKGRIGVYKFIGSAASAAGCLVGLAIVHGRTGISAYLENNFVGDVGKAIAFGAALGSAMATIDCRVSWQAQRHMKKMARLHAMYNPAPGNINPFSRNHWTQKVGDVFGLLFS